MKKYELKKNYLTESGNLAYPQILKETTDEKNYILTLKGGNGVCVLAERYVENNPDIFEELYVNIYQIYYHHSDGWILSQRREQAVCDIELLKWENLFFNQEDAELECERRNNIVKSIKREREDFMADKKIIKLLQ